MSDNGGCTAQADEEEQTEAVDAVAMEANCGYIETTLASIGGDRKMSMIFETNRSFVKI
jgi:hypothetical protein